MATVHNPSRWELFCHALGRSIGPRQTIEVDDDRAASVPTSVFVVKGLSNSSGAPTRTTAKRGGKVAEITEGPVTETR